MQTQVSETIEFERMKLLDKIHDLESNELTDSDTARRDLKLRYNTVSSENLEPSTAAFGQTPRKNIG
jgi:hypothetical protein